MFEATEAVDAGPVYMRDAIRFQGAELLPEMPAILGAKIIEMCTRFMSEYPDITEHGQPQVGPGSRYRVRTPEDSRLDPNQTIAGQFDLLRVVDSKRYPAFFELRGRKYIVTIEPAKDHDL